MIFEEPTPTPAPAIKQGVRPENLRILPCREVRVAMLSDSGIFCSLWSDLKAAEVSTFGAGASLVCSYSESDFLWYRQHENGVLEFSEIWYDIKCDDSVWAIQKADNKGCRNFSLEVLDGQRCPVHRVNLNPSSDLNSYLQFIRSNQARLPALESPLSWAGFHATIQSRREKWKSRVDLARRVEHNRVNDFIESLSRLKKEVRLTVWNGAIKHSTNVELTSCQMHGRLLEMQGNRKKFILDTDCLMEAWIVQCHCFCGEEILEMYGRTGQLMASIVFTGLSRSTMSLLPALN